MGEYKLASSIQETHLQKETMIWGQVENFKIAPSKDPHGGVPKQPNDQIVILVSSLRKVAELGIPFVFTNQHAYPVTAEYFNNLDDLARVDWPLLQARDFRHDPEDPGKKERYQAEALVHRHLPVSGLLGIGCHSNGVSQQLQTELQSRNLSLRVAVQPGWYF